MRAELKQIEAELARVGGRVEWATDIGVGVSFSNKTTDEGFTRIPQTINRTVWINLEDARVTDVTLAQLEGAPVLEAVKVAGTPVTASALKRLLQTTPMLREVVLSVGQFSQEELTSVRRIAPHVRFIETG